MPILRVNVAVRSDRSFC